MTTKLTVMLAFICLAVHAQTFTKTPVAGIFENTYDSRSISWVDYDNDGFNDIFLTNGPTSGQNNILYKNIGGSYFAAVTADTIVRDKAPSDGASWADIDNDGDADCFVANWYNKNNILYINQGNGSFYRHGTGPLVNNAGYSETGSWCDYDKDGLVDILVTNSAGSKLNFLYHNDGAGNFSRVNTGIIATDAKESRQILWCDFDNNGYSDALVTNESAENEDLYMNQGNGTFTKVNSGSLVQNGGNTMGASFSDADNDGDMDVYLVNHGGYSCLFLNNGGNSFVKQVNDTSAKVLTNGFGSTWGDIDNDGDEDLFICNGFSSQPQNNILYINNGHGHMTRAGADVLTSDSGCWFGCAFGDYNNDGFLDLAIASCDNTIPSVLYTNTGNLNNWLMIKCRGVISNQMAIGARVKLKATINGNIVWQMRELTAQSGYNGQNMSTLHFGLKQAVQADSVVIYWPSGLVDSYTNVLANQVIQVTEGNTLTGVAGRGATPVSRLNAKPNPFSETIHFSFELSEKSTVSLAIMDMKGNTVLTIVNSEMNAGKQHLTWKPGQNNVKPTEGVYLCVLKIGSEVITRKLVYLHP